jgi:lysophospholipase L1-like esterase
MQPKIKITIIFIWLIVFNHLIAQKSIELPKAQKEPIRILCVGDSITQGGKRDRQEYTYRYPLFQMLKDARIHFDFIGTQSQGLQPDARWPNYRDMPFDPDHEGYYGAKTATVRNHLLSNLPKLPPPDYALVHLGTNDLRSDDYVATVQKPLSQIIEMLRDRNPNVTILLGHLNFNGGPAETKLRPLVEDLTKLSTPKSKVITVHHYQGWIEHPNTPGTDTFDWAHPNPQGQLKMAANWFRALDLNQRVVTFQSELFIIGIDAKENLYLNGNPTQKETLAKVLDQYMSLDPSRSVQIRADKTVQYGAVVEMIDLCKKHGADNVALSVRN